MSTMVVDASMAATWMLVDEQSDSADLVLDLLRSSSGIFPSLFWYETRQLFLKAERRQRCSIADTRQFLIELSALPLRSAPDGSDEAILTLARTHKLSAYDATYLESAITAKMPLATADRRLAAAARAAGVALLGPFAASPLAP